MKDYATAYLDDGGDIVFSTYYRGYYPEESTSRGPITIEASGNLIDTLRTQSVIGNGEGQNCTRQEVGSHPSYEEMSGDGTYEYDGSINYCIALTGGSITIENNITYLTPEELAIVNKPIGSFAGTRSITGNVTCYLNSGTQNSARMLGDLAEFNEVIQHRFFIEVALGGRENAPYAKFVIPNGHVSIPSLNVEDVISLDVSFTAQGSGKGISSSDELFFETSSQTYHL